MFVDFGEGEQNISPLRLACKGGHVNIVQELLNHPHIDPNSFGDAMRELSHVQDKSLEVPGMIGTMLCKKGYFHPSDHLDEEKDQELIQKLCKKLAPKKSARNCY
mmetsp:Transcript_96263/g.144138  ORF Transcript_96263/g.144138 Transcript_96263/m.144138 type:complete len:105 (-) Transcript_96263:27-341(-)